MPLVVMTSHTGLFRALGAPPFVRAHLDVLTAPSGQEVLDLVRDLSPGLALLEVVPPEWEGLALRNDAQPAERDVLHVRGDLGLGRPERQPEPDASAAGLAHRQPGAMGIYFDEHQVLPAGYLALLEGAEPAGDRTS